MAQKKGKKTQQKKKTKKSYTIVGIILIILALAMLFAAYKNTYTKQDNQAGTQETIGDVPSLPIPDESGYVQDSEETIGSSTIFSGDCLAQGGELINTSLTSCSNGKEVVELSDEENEDFVCCI